MSDLYSVKPCVHDDPAPGVHLMRAGVLLNRLSPAEARSLGADLILAANTSEAQWPVSRDTTDTTEEAGQ